MAIETEEKFTMDVSVFNNNLKAHCTCATRLKQAYINESSDWVTFLVADRVGNSFVSLKSRTGKSDITFPIGKEDYRDLIKSQGVYAEDDSYRVDPQAWALRIRIDENDTAVFCFKERIAGASRAEYETLLPIADATDVYQTLLLRIHKIRHLLIHEGYTWEIDIFLDDNEGLCIAEIETEDKDFPLIEGLREKVTSDVRYYNAELCSNPFTHWGTV